ncbi:hypothetical protein C0U41_29700, partial [Klebsiella pneumoniae]
AKVSGLQQPGKLAVTLLNGRAEAGTGWDKAVIPDMAEWAKVSGLQQPGKLAVTLLNGRAEAGTGWDKAVI